MSGSNSDDQGKMSDHGNDNAATSAIAVWDEKAVSDMYLSLAEVRGGFSAAEAKDVEVRMREKGYNFTAKQLLTKHGKVRAKMAAAHPAGAANGNGNAEVKPNTKAKAAPKPRGKAAQKVDADGNSITPKARTPRRPAAKKAAATPKDDVDKDGNEIEAEAPPSKKRKAAGPKAGKKVIQQTFKDEEAEEEYDAPEGEGDTSIMDVDGSSDANGGSAPAAAVQVTKNSAEADAQKTKEDAASAAEMTKVNAAHAAQMTKVEAQSAENFVLPKDEGDSFTEQMELVQASKADVDAKEHVQVETVVQTSA